MPLSRGLHTSTKHSIYRLLHVSLNESCENNAQPQANERQMVDRAGIAHLRPDFTGFERKPSLGDSEGWGLVR